MDGSPESILPNYQTKTIIAAALLEGSGFLNLVAFMLEHNKWSLIQWGLGILFTLSMIPSEMKIATGPMKSFGLRPRSDRKPVPGVATQGVLE